MKKKIVGYVCRREDTKEGTYSISDENIRKAIITSGGVPLLIVSSQGNDYIDKEPVKVAAFTEEEKNDLHQILDLCDAFILPGGYIWYELDELIIAYAIKNDKPLLGICLGMQVLGKMINKEETERAKDSTIKNETSFNHCCSDEYAHYVHIKKGSKLYEAVGSEQLLVNSRHNYHIPKLEEDYISAYSEDGLIEGIELSSKKFIVGTQWHPENLIEKDEASQKIFKKLLSFH